MAMADYIPAGRTSRIVRGPTELQIQTEYAYRPNPRLTTTVFSSGQVIHKIEKELASPITTQEDKMKIEGLLRKQHMEVMEVINSDNFLSILARDKKPASEKPKVSVGVRLAEVDGVEKIFRIDNEGNFETDTVSAEFKRKYSVVFKNLSVLLNIFRSEPGGRREEGVYEVEHNRLYLISTGYECYFILTRRHLPDRDFEAEFHSVLKAR
jgi:hypothetical protein